MRDLGALDGVRPGVLMRSDNLQGLTPNDVRRLVDELGVRVVVDLRTDDEVQLEGEGPLVRDGRVEIRHRPLWLGDGMGGDIVAHYLGYVYERPEAIVGALEDIAAGPGPVIVHCAAGKDRTGIVVAMALAAVGVPREAIMTDFLLTGDRITQLMARLRASPTYGPALEPYSDESRKPRAEVLGRVLDVLDERHGGAAGWLAEHGFDPAALRARLRD
jgi:protein-tyrosine phosphatase